MFLTENCLNDSKVFSFGTEGALTGLKRIAYGLRAFGNSTLALMISFGFSMMWTPEVCFEMSTYNAIFLASVDLQLMAECSKHMCYPTDIPTYHPL